MQINKALIAAIVSGIILLGIGIAFSQAYFSYSDTRIVSINVVADPYADIALIPNNDNLGYSTSNTPFVTVTNNVLTITFGNVAPNTTVTLGNIFYVKNNLNTTVTVTITTSSSYLMASPYHFTLAPGQEEGISLTLMVPYGASLGAASFQITVTAST